MILNLNWNHICTCRTIKDKLACSVFFVALMMLPFVKDNKETHILMMASYKYDYSYYDFHTKVFS